jgi:hypothetical protein
MHGTLEARKQVNTLYSVYTLPYIHPMLYVLLQ